VTEAGYASAYSLVRLKAGRLDMESMSRVRAIYVAAAGDAGRVLRSAVERSMSPLTVERWAQVQAALSDAADSLARAIEEEAGRSALGAASLSTGIQYAYAMDAAREAGAALAVRGLKGMVSMVNRRVVEELARKVWSDGYTLSQRVWDRARSDWLNRVRTVLSVGLSEGRDPVKIAADLGAYTSGGSVKLIGRWGTLKRGTSEFARRIPGQIDWRATRLVRSELYAALQSASASAGAVNPGCTGEFDWVLSAGRQHWDCTCEGLAAASPYSRASLPGYPHSNCMCTVTPKLRPRGEFVADLKRWAGGDGVEYLDEWERSIEQA
jgi:hypothetical protein